MLPALVSSSLALNLKPDSPHYLFANRCALYSAFFVYVITGRCIVIGIFDGRVDCLWNRRLNGGGTFFYETDFNGNICKLIPHLS
jgi:hypothetical protein